MAADEIRNKLLRLIPENELSQIIDVSERIRLQPRQVLHHYRLPLDHVYFVESGLVSVAAKISMQNFVEVWLIGSEGLVGAPVVLGPNTPLHRRTVQVGGEALRIRTSEFRELVRELPHLHAVIHAYLAVVLVQTSQSGACNSVHSLKQRLARWLMVARNALGDDEIPLTHKVLSELLGVRRASVTECLEALQRDGMITSRRGLTRIEEPTKLSRACCECFKLIEREHRRQLLRLGRAAPMSRTGTGRRDVPAFGCPSSADH
jgi:CRP-like cAMP-binding protein